LSRNQKSIRRTRQLLKAFKQPVGVVEFDEERLEDVLMWVRDHGVANMVVSWKAIDQAGGISRDSTVTLSIQDLTLGEVLGLVLEQVAPEALTPEDELTFHVFKGILRVSTRSDFDRRTYTRTYYVEDLLYSITKNEYMPFIAVGRQFNYVASAEAVVASGAAAIAPNVETLDLGTTLGPGDQADERPDFEQDREEELERLLDLIRSLRPDTWTDNGGRGTVQPFSDKLVITQTIEMHEIIGGTFMQLQRFRVRG
jgi:hypothetical protein